MAAPLMRCMNFSVKTVKTCILPRPIWLFRPNNTYTCFTVNSVRNLATDAVDNEGKDKETDDLMRKRDVCRMPGHLARRMSHRMKPPDLSFGLPFMETKEYKRQIYAKYGKSSGIDPGIMWPSKEELTEILEDEKEFGQPTLRSMVRGIENTKRKQARLRRYRENIILRKMEEMPQVIKEFKKKRIRKKEKLAQEQAKLDTLLEEARDVYGYTVRPKSEKFKELMSQKAKEKKERKREERKHKREEFLKKGLARSGEKSAGDGKEEVKAEKQTGDD